MKILVTATVQMVVNAEDAQQAGDQVHRELSKVVEHGALLVDTTNLNNVVVEGITSLED